MRILFTGASSFTGMWFVEELVRAGHRVGATFQKGRGDYTGLRARRVERLLGICEPFFHCSFGSDQLLELASRGWDLFCHHAADVTDYKSAAFDPLEAASRNTKGVELLLDRLQAGGCHHFLLTGSVFEQGEGAGSDGIRAVSPYGLSKGLTWEIVRYWSQVKGVTLGKFVIPNPFGPYEEVRYTTFLIQNWQRDAVPEVRFPNYVRDNIPVSLLAKRYCRFAKELLKSEVPLCLNPSGYCGRQGEFTEQFALQMRRHLGWPCRYRLAEQKVFDEPKERINTDPVDGTALGWSEERAWEELAAYYREQYGG